MTTPEPLGGGSQQPQPVSTHPLTAPISPEPTGTTPPQPTKSMGLALAALIVGIAAFLVGLVPVFGALVGIVGVVLGILALRKQQSKGMALTGIILGAIAALVSIGMTMGIGAAVNSASDDESVATVSESEASEPQESTEPAEEAEVPAPQAAEIPAEFKSALTKAESYSDSLHMSKAGVYDQLTSEFGEKFAPEAAQYAVDNVQADWNANALAKAKSYQESMAMSPEAIREQLTSEFGEKFTPEEADFAIVNLNG